jgi:hypothetical protein
MTTRRGHKPVDLSSLREALATGEMWSAIGVVRAREGEDSHFAIDDGDVLVDVDLSPEGTPVVCRLGAAGGLAGGGVWRVPPAGTEVAVMVIGGDPRAMPIIVAALPSGTLPAGVDEDVLLVVNPKKVRIVSTDEDVEVVASGSGKKVKLQGGGKGVARLDDTVDCGYLLFTPSTPPTLEYVGPGLGTFPPGPGTQIHVTGKIDSASDKTETG